MKINFFSPTNGFLAVVNLLVIIYMIKTHVIWFKKLRNKKTGEFYERQGVSQTSADQVLARLKEKGYIDDERFAKWWIENRNQKKGSSIKKLRLELQQKGVARSVIDQVVEDSNRGDDQEIKKIIAKKAKRYTDQQKFIAYLLRQGFLYDDILRELNGSRE